MYAAAHLRLIDSVKSVSDELRSQENEEVYMCQEMTIIEKNKECYCIQRYSKEAEDELLRLWYGAGENLGKAKRIIESVQIPEDYQCLQILL